VRPLGLKNEMALFAGVVSITPVISWTVPPALTTVSLATGLVVSDIPTDPSTTHNLSQTLGDSGTPTIFPAATQTAIPLTGGGLGLCGSPQRQHMPRTQALQMVEVTDVVTVPRAQSPRQGLGGTRIQSPPSDSDKGKGAMEIDEANIGNLTDGLAIDNAAHEYSMERGDSGSTNGRMGQVG